jgi:hypothetical protein
MGMTDGPPSRLSVGREVRLDRPHLFDLDALRDLRAVHRSNSEPFCREIARGQRNGLTGERPADRHPGLTASPP